MFKSHRKFQKLDPKRRLKALGAASRCRFEWLEDRTLMSALTIAQENQLTGTPSTTWDISGAGDTTLQGFATNIGTNVGGTVQFKVDDSTLGSYHIEIYRLGYYQGNGARLVTTIATANTVEKAQPAGITNSSTGELDCGNWSVSASWTIPVDATSGVYIADLVRDTNGARSQIPFIVRNDASHSDFIFQTSDTTWQAYNDYGGKSLYDYQSPSGRAYKVSYNRPFNTRADSAEDYLMSAEYPMIRWMEQNGYDVSYTSATDTDRNGSLLLNHKVYLSVGHDEYWSAGERTNVQAARDAGVNLAFFSGNEVLWKTRWENSIDGSNTAYRTLVCYKESLDDAVTDPSGIWTGQWADTRFSPPLDGANPGNALTGQAPIVNDGAKGAVQVASADGKMRFWRNTTVATLASGTSATLSQNTLGYEWDTPIDNGYQPAGLIYLTTTSVASAPVMQGYSADYASAPATQHATLYRAPSGALVFGAGVVQWQWGLDSHHDTMAGTSTADARMQQATVNLFADMGVQPATLMSGLVAAAKSTDVTPATAVITSPLNNATITLGSTVTISGTATDAGGGVVGAVEVSVDGGLTWHPATGRGSWTYAWAPSSGGPRTILARATDDSLNTQTTPASITVNVTGLTGQTLLGDTLPTGTAQVDSALELGVKFRSDVAGTITGIRFYKFSSDTGTHIGNLWSSTGTKLATITFTNETASGWQTATFSTPIAVQANTTYVASYFAPNAGYAAQDYYFYANSGTAQIHGLRDGTDGANGVYKYTSSSAFPSTAATATNYFVDVFFTPGVDNTPPTVTGTVPASGATNVATGAPITATFSESIKSSSLSFTVKDAANNAVSGTTSYNDTTRTATFTPTSALAANTTFTATVMASDLANNAMTAPKLWSFTTAPPDTTPPTIASRSPLPGATGVLPSTTVTVTFSEAVKSDVSLSVVLTNASNQVVASTVSYDPNSFTATLTPNAQLALGSTYTVTVSATDLAGNAMSPANWSFTTTSNVTASLWSNSVVPGVVADSDGNASEIGTKFRSTMAGYITAIRYYKSSTNTGTHVGHLWTSTGTLLATVTFSGESSTGWQQALLSTPVAIAANTTYIVSYFAPNGHYAEDDGYFATSHTSGPLTALADGSDGPNGVYAYSSGNTFPTQTWMSANYYVDVVFNSTIADTTPPTVTARTPAAGATNVALATTATATFNEAVQSGSIVFTLTNTSNNTAVAGTTSYNANTSTATFTPSAMLAPGATYSAAVSATDLAGNAMTAPSTWSFTTGVPDTTPPTVTARTPVAGAINVALTSPATATFSEAVQSGSVVFTLTNTSSNTAVAGTTSYNANTSTATFTPSASLSPGVIYSASVSATDLAGNAMSAPSTWTFATVPPDTTPPTVTARTPAAGATNVSISTTATATFSEAVQSGSIVFTLTNTSNSTVVAGTTSYNANTSTATFTPSSPLAANVTYSASVSATDVAGNSMSAPSTWSFTTGAAFSNYTFWPSTATPASTDSDTHMVEIGMQFQSSVSGFVTAIRFYKSSVNTGTHVGHLWDGNGNLLATVSFTSETSSGWQQANLSTPVAISANTTYVVSYYAPVGRYSVSSQYFTTARTSGPISTPVNAGVYAYATGGAFPTNVYNAENYWVDVVFQASGFVDTTPPTIVAQTPASGATGFSRTANLTVAFSEPINASSLVITLKNPSNQVIASVLTYDANAWVATLNPNTTLVTKTIYTVTVSATDLAGNPMTPVTWSFTTA